jgi:MoxR-like ATPase
MQQIIDVHYPHVKQDLVRQALEVFFNLREANGLKKKPSTSELLDWLKLLMAEDIDAKTLHDKAQKGGLMPMFGALLKNEQDISLIEKLAFMSRR